MENYAAARDAADRVIASNDYELSATYAESFNQDDNTDEDIFATQISELDGSNVMNTYFSINDFGGRADVEIEPEHLALYDPADLRLGLFYEDGGVTYTGKFNSEFGNLSSFELQKCILSELNVMCV